MAVQEIYVELKPDQGVDPRGESLRRELQDVYGIQVDAIDAITIYSWEDITREEAGVLRIKALTNPLLEHSSLAEPEPKEGTTRIRIDKNPGVMDPREDSMRRVAGYFNIQAKAVATSVVYNIHGELTDEQLALVREHIPSQLEHVADTPPETLIYDSEPAPVETIRVRVLDTEQLVKLSQERKLVLNAEEMTVIRDYFRSINRDPTDIELETLAQTWSEHNGHKTFKAKLVDKYGVEHEPLIDTIRLSSYPFLEKNQIISAFKDNAGVMVLGNGKHAVNFKAETHNWPVSIAPFAGADTKNGGLIRDIVATGQGGENIITWMVNNIASPYMTYEEVPPGALPPRHILTENSRGERNYGNKIGIATAAITNHYDDSFIKPMSMGIAVGIIPIEQAIKGEPVAGDVLLTMGGRTGRDGIHGANASSADMTHASKRVDATTVQEGNPIEQKRMFDVVKILGKEGLIRAMTDCGGGGYSSSIGELGSECGVEVYLDRVPLKYKGLSAWEIWLSESQERLVFSIAPEHVAEVQRICELYEVPVDAIGKFTGDGQLRLYDSDQMVGELSMDFLHNGLPQRVMKMRYKEREEKNGITEEPTNWQEAFEKVLGHLNIASEEAMLRRYDQTVQGRRVLERFTGVHNDARNDASVDLALYGETYGVVLAQALNPKYMQQDPRQGGILAVAQAYSNLVAHGGNPDKVALMDNIVWPGTDEEELANLHAAVQGMCHAARELEGSFASGKDSLSARYVGPDGEIIKNIPTLNITAVSTIPDVGKTVSVDIKSTDSVLCFVGKRDASRMGASIFYETRGVENSHIPDIDLSSLLPTFRTIHRAIESGKVKSCKAIGEGGLATALPIMCFGGDCGAEVNMNAFAGRGDAVLFNETPGCFVIEVQSEEDAKELFGNTDYVLFGKTNQSRELSIQSNGNQKGNVDLEALKYAWQRPMQEFF